MNDQQELFDVGGDGAGDGAGDEFPVSWLTLPRRALIYRTVLAVATFLVVIGVITDEVALGLVALVGTILSTGMAVAYTKP